MRLEEIPKEQWLVLASALYQPAFEPWTTYAERVYCLEPQLNRALLRPDFLHRLYQFSRLRVTQLCGLHKILNSKTVHQLFVLVTAEVGLRLNSIVVAGRDKVGHEIWDRDILNLRSLHGAWLPSELFWDTFGSALDVPPDGHTDEDYLGKWIGDEARCEACILTQIGGDFDTVLDLRMAIKSRTRTRSEQKGREPRLSGLVEGWLSVWRPYFSDKEWESRLTTNHSKILHLKDVRKDVSRQKRKSKSGRVAKSARHEKADHSARRTRGTLRDGKATHAQRNYDLRRSEDIVAGNIWPQTDRPQLESKLSTVRREDDNDDDDDDEERNIRNTLHQAENDIIDCYAALISTPFLPGMGIEEHQKRYSVLSRFSASTVTRDQIVPRAISISDSHPDGLRRAQSQRQSQSSIYSGVSMPSDYPEPTYYPTFTYPHQPSGGSDILRRSRSVQDKRVSDKSWVTASVPPSEVSTSVSRATRRPSYGQTRHRRRIDTITEETDAPRNGHVERKRKHSHRHRPSE